MKHRQDTKALYLLAGCFILLLLIHHVPAQAPGDNPPTADSVQANPQYAGVGDTIIITANASDDIGLKGVYFYSPDSSQFAFMDCAGATQCSVSASKVVDKIGINRFCVRAIDTSNQLSAYKCVDVEVTLDRPPIIKYFYAEQKEKERPTVHVGGTVKFFVIAEDDVGVVTIYIEDVATGTINEQNCSSLRNCVYEYKRLFNDQGTFTFCTWAVDTAGQRSGTKCMEVNVITKYSCEAIMLDDTESNRVVGLRVTSKRLYLDRDGLIGYSSECCMDYGFCKDLMIDAKTCEKMRGSLEADSYQVLMWNPNQTTISSLLDEYEYPQILCSTTIGNYTYIGVIENSYYKALSQVQNLEENFMTYWLTGQNKTEQAATMGLFASYAEEDNTTFAPAAAEEVAPRYFFAEQLQKEGNETKVTTIVDSVNYSDAMNKLLENECMTKDMETGECQFDCPDYDPRCGAPCGGPCLGCAGMPPSKCFCCMQCQKLEHYTECVYNRYKQAYGRPFADYLYCWKVPELKDTAWCYQKSDQPTSAVNYPWYSLTRNESGDYLSLGTVTDEYIDEIHKWNEIEEVNERPSPEKIAYRVWVPEVYCSHSFDSKLFRDIWTKIFTITPYLNDFRNDMTWTRTGPGKLYAGGGFRREPACWWECCRRCAPFCDCMCYQCTGIPCCISASFSSGVTNVIEFTVTDTTVTAGAMRVTYNSDRRVATVDNGAVKIISTGNIPFSVSASFSKNEATGKYRVVLNYRPSSSYVQFVIDQDIVFSYDLREDAEQFTTGITETFSTSLGAAMCTCQPKIPIIVNGVVVWVCPSTACVDGGSCCCCPNGGAGVSTTVSVSDGVPTTISLHKTKIEALREAANEFVDISTGRGIRTGIVAFSTGIMYTSVAPTLDADQLHLVIDRYQSNAATCIECGVRTAIGLLRNEQTPNKYIIVMSDGVPNVGSTNAAAIGAMAQSNGIILHAVALGNTADRAFMQRLAEAGGGQFYDVVCDCPLDCIYKTLAESVDGSTVLVSDVSGSMSAELDLYCRGGTTPIVYKFGALNITVSGNIDNYLDSDVTTIARSKGNITVTATPDIINEVSLNIDKSSMDYYSLIYPVRHKAYRKQYAHGWWAPGIPYAVGEMREYEPKEGYREYSFDDAYGYESKKYDYPKQCQQLCPADCTCPDYDIMDPTCIDESGEKYKRTDCVCMPPKGHTYETPCTSDRTFHDEELYYFDFAELETREVGKDLNISGQIGTNPEATGNLRGDVFHDPGGWPFNTTYLFITNPEENTLSKVSSEDCRLVCSINITPQDNEPINAVVEQRGGVWVASRSTNGVSWFNETSDCAKPKKLGPFIVGRGPRALAVDARNMLWVANEFDNNVWVLNASTGECVKGYNRLNANCSRTSSPINLSAGPYAAAYDCVGNVWVLCRGNPAEEGRLYKINGTSYSIEGNYSVGGETYSLAADGSGNVWLSGSTSGKVWKINGRTGAVICEADAGEETTGLAVDEENNVWVADATANKVIKIDGYSANCEVLAEYDTGLGPIGVTLDYSGNVWTVNRLTGDARKYNTSTGTELCSVYVGLAPYIHGDFAGYSLNKKCLGREAKRNETKKPDGKYVFNFEALNFPYPLLEYNESRWYQISQGQDCHDYCSSLGLLAAPVCNCSLGTEETGCLFFTKANGTAVCTEECRITRAEPIGGPECCCARPSFITEKANMTFLIHFRDDEATQTFNLTPKRIDYPSYAVVTFNVSIRNPSRVFCETMPKNARPGQQVYVNMTLIDALTTKGISDEMVRIELEGYRVSNDLQTDSRGNAQLNFTALNQSTKINCVYPGGNDYTESSGYSYVNVYGLDKFWWFISPEAVLLLVVIIILAFSYRWFGGGGLDLYSMWRDFKGKGRK